MQSAELDRRLQLVREIAFAAGEIVLEHYTEDVEITWKSPGNPVTAADHAANEFILEKLQQQFSGEAVLSEETRDDMSRLGKDLIWVVDPLDGTKEFIKRNGEFSIMIGLVESGRPVLGAVCQPTTKTVYFGAVAMGAWSSSPSGVHALRVSNKTKSSELRMVASRSHFDERIERVRKRLGIGTLLRSGSVGLKCGLIARGECEVYVHPSTRVSMWDSCGPAAMLVAAGGVMTDLKGDPLDYSGVDVRHRHGLLATHGRLHDQIVEILREAACAAA